MADTHRYVGNYPREVYVGDKTIMAEPGQFFDFSKKEDLEANQTLLDDGMFLNLKNGTTQTVQGKNQEGGES